MVVTGRRKGRQVCDSAGYDATGPTAGYDAKGIHFRSGCGYAYTLIQFSRYKPKGDNVRLIRRYLIAAVCLVGVSGTALAIAPDFMDKLADESRPMEDRIRDGARRPYQVMMLLGVEEGMTAIDIGAGGGWWTRVFSAAVGSDGTVYAQGMRGDSSSIEALGNVEVAAALADIGSGVADVAVTALNVHHMNAERAGPYFAGIFDVLKSGGKVAVIDHAGDASNDNSGLHRIPAASVRDWLEAAGFEVEESPILRSAADDRTLSASDPRLGRNADRFLFVATKP